MELTKIHVNLIEASTADELKQVYTEYYSLTKVLEEKSGRNLLDLLPEEIKQKIES